MTIKLWSSVTVRILILLMLFSHVTPVFSNSNTEKESPSYQNKQNILIEYIYQNWFKGYTLELSIRPDGSYEIKSSDHRKKDDPPKVVKKDKLTADKFKTLQTLITNINFSKIKDSYKAQHFISDASSVIITMHSKNRSKTVKFSTGAVLPKEMKELIGFINKLLWP